MHKGKRKAGATEWERLETSDVDFSDNGHEEDELHLSRSKRRNVETGSPGSKERSSKLSNDTRLQNQANDSAVHITSSLSPTPPSRSPSPSPQVKRTAVSEPELLKSGWTRPRLMVRARTQQHKPVPDVSTEARIPSSESSAPASNRYTTRHYGRPLSPSLVNRRKISELFSGFSPGASSHSSAKNGDLQPIPTSSGGFHAASSARAGGLRRMLTKTQSLGVSEPSTPSPSKQDKKDDDKVGPASSRILTAPSTPSRLALRRTQSMPSSPAVPSPQGADIDSAFAARPQIMQQPGSEGRAKKTYGKVRTIMVELPRGPEDGDQSSYDTMSQGDESQLHASYVELRQRYEVDNTIQHTSRSASLLQDMLQARAPETVSDMRSRGENRRFIDELGYLFDGISDPAANSSFRRSR